MLTYNNPLVYVLRRYDNDIGTVKQKLHVFKANCHVTRMLSYLLNSVWPSFLPPLWMNSKVEVHCVSQHPEQSQALSMEGWGGCTAPTKKQTPKHIFIKSPTKWQRTQQDNRCHFKFTETWWSHFQGHTIDKWKEIYQITWIILFSSFMYLGVVFCLRNWK